jgi:hypothetical protein
MPYEHLEEFLERGDEKFLGPLSIANLAGALVGGGAGYQAAALLGLPLALSAGVTLLLAATGGAATWRVGGMTALSRLHWQLRFWARQTIDPAAALIDPARQAAAPASRQTPLLLRRGGQAVAIARARGAETSLADERARGER